MFRPVAAESAFVAHLVRSPVQGFDDGGRQRTRHVADAQADEPCLRVGGPEFRHAAGDVGKKIVFLDAQEMFVDCCHRISCF